MALKKNTLEIEASLNVQNEFASETSPLRSVINGIYIIASLTQLF